MSKKCLGCGVTLQCNDINQDGYVNDLEMEFCNRCFNIKNYGKNSHTKFNNLNYLDNFKRIKDSDVVVYVSSLLTLNLDYISKFKKVILVLTKRDILPKSIKDHKIISYVRSKYSNILDIFIVSAYRKYNMDNLYNALIKYGNRADIYFVGITNSGKSTLINQLINSYGNGCGNITTSNYPSTTLDIIPIKIGDIMIYDTPGLIVEDSIINYLDDSRIKCINSKKEIKPITFQVKGKGAILIDNILRVEYSTISSSMTFYVSNNLDVSSINISNPRFRDCEYTVFNDVEYSDIVIEDVGFIKITKSINLKILSDKMISIRERDNLI